MKFRYGHIAAVEVPSMTCLSGLVPRRSAAWIMCRFDENLVGNRATFPILMHFPEIRNFSYVVTVLSLPSACAGRSTGFGTAKFVVVLTRMQ